MAKKEYLYEAKYQQKCEKLKKVELLLTLGISIDKNLGDELSDEKK